MSDPTVETDLTNEDYLIRSLDGLFVPMAVTACSALLLLAAHELARNRLGPSRRAAVARGRQIFVLTLIILGSLLALGGFVSTFTTTFLASFVVGPPLCRCRHPV